MNFDAALRKQRSISPHSGGAGRTDRYPYCILSSTMSTSLEILVAFSGFSYIQSSKFKIVYAICHNRTQKWKRGWGEKDQFVEIDGFPGRETDDRYSVRDVCSILYPTYRQGQKSHACLSACAVYRYIHLESRVWMYMYVIGGR